MVETMVRKPVVISFLHRSQKLKDWLQNKNDQLWCVGHIVLKLVRRKRYYTHIGLEGVG